MTFQNHEKKASRMITFDLSGECKMYGLTSYQLLMYVLGTQPWIPVLAVNIDGYDELAYEDPDWVRDCHVIIVKLLKDDELKENDEKVLIDGMSSQMSKEQIDIILQIMIKRLTISNKANAATTEILSTLTEMDKLINTVEDGKAIAGSALKVWFSDIIQGAFGITRSLNVQKINTNASSITDPLTKAVQHQTANKAMLNFKVKNLVLLDNVWYLISSEEARKSKLIIPKEMPFVFVGITNNRQNFKRKHQPQVIQQFETKYVDDEKKENANYGYATFIEEVMGEKYLKLYHGSHVFNKVFDNIVMILNSRRFHDWIESVGWTLWLGSSEQDKIDDHRMLANEVKKLQKENMELKRKINENDV